MLAFCHRHTVPRLVHISTPSLYFAFADQFDLREEIPLPDRFVNDYAASKHQAELLLRQERGDDGPEIAILRPRGLFGPYDTALMPRLERVARRGFFPLPLGGHALVDITHVDNVVREC